ncbi:MAG: MFS transporter [Armatimonadetes bacterium]|nr:MFS transporter [Armatimonadota bacterium]
MTLFLDLMGFGIVLPLLPLYAKQLHASYNQVGALTTAYAMMEFIFAPLWGRLSDRYGRRPLILLSLSGSTLAFAVLGFSWSLWMLFLVRAIGGILSSASLPAAQAYIADTTTPETRAKGMGMIGAAFGLGFIFGPFIGGTLSYYFGFQTPFFVAAALCFGNFLMALAFLPESLKPETREGNRGPVRLIDVKALLDSVKSPAVGALLAVMALSTFAFANLQSMWVFTLQSALHLPSEQAARLYGYLLAVIGLVVIIIQGGLIGRIVRRFGEEMTVRGGMVFLILAFGLITIVKSYPMMILAAALLAAGRGVSDPAMTTILSKRSVQSSQGSIMGVAQSLGSLSRVLGPLWGGFLFQHYGPASPMVSGIIVLLAGLALSLRIESPHLHMESAV